jgi:hypothetical protein
MVSTPAPSQCKHGSEGGKGGATPFVCSTCVRGAQKVEVVRHAHISVPCWGMGVLHLPCSVRLMGAKGKGRKGEGHTFTRRPAFPICAQSWGGVMSQFPLALSPKTKRTRSYTSCESTHVTSGVNTRQTPSNLTGIRTMETTAWQLDALSSRDRRGSGRRGLSRRSGRVDI